MEIFFRKIHFSRQGDTLFYIGEGTYKVLASGANGCDTLFSFDFPATDHTAAFNVDTLICMRDLGSFQNASVDAIMAFQWSLGDGNGATSENPSHQYEYAGRFNVVFTVQFANSCYDTVYKTMLVDPLVQIPFVEDDDSICIGQQVNFESQYDNTVIKLHWDFGDNNIWEGIENYKVHQHILKKAWYSLN